MGAGQLIVEVVAVGTELLLGEIVNSNSAAIGRRLAGDGFDSHYQVVVGDNMDRLVIALSEALERSDAVVITGGIGPTQDDMTREAICSVAGVAMMRDDDHASWIERRITSQGRTVASNVLRMADLPVGAEGLPNSNGAALGVAMEHGGKWMFAMPGVPAEMTVMLDNEVLPRLRLLDRQPAVLRSRVLHTWGHGESTVADLLGDLYESTNPSIAFLIRDMEVRVRISAKATDEGSAMALIAPFEEEVRSRLGEAVFAADDQIVEEIVLADLNRAGWTISTVERATVGQVGARLASNDSTGRYAGTLIAGREAGQPPTADVTLDVGDIASETGDDEGTTRRLRMSVATPREVVKREFRFGGSDERVRSFATIAGLHLLRTVIQAGKGSVPTE